MNNFGELVFNHPPESRIVVRRIENIKRINKHRSYQEEKGNSHTISLKPSNQIKDQLKDIPLSCYNKIKCRSKSKKNATKKIK